MRAPLAENRACAAPPGCSGAPRSYRRREPERTLLHRLVRENLATFTARAAERYPATGALPPFVEGELRRYLTCGVLANGFARVRCPGCGHDFLVAFSCKGRGFCPSCGARRMADTAAFLVDHVLPDVPVRQWVLSLPRRHRYLLAYRPKLVTSVLASLVGAVFAWQRRRARRLGVAAPSPGAVTFVQRFGSALNLNVHFHVLVPDAVFASAGDAGAFREIGGPGDDDVEAVLRRAVRRISALLESLHADVVEEAPSPLLDACVDALTPAPAASVREPHRAPRRRQAFVDGYSLDASVSVGAGHRTALEAVCRYGARPPLAPSRLGTDENGRVTYRLRRPRPGGATSISLEPEQFLGRLAALVPPPRMHAVRYHGVYAPNARLRPLAVALAPANLAGPSGPLADRPGPSPSPSQRRDHRSSRRRRFDWATLLRRVFAIDVLACPRCGKRMRVIALIEDRAVARRILEHLDLPTTPTIYAPARSPPDVEFPGWADSAFIDPPAPDLYD